MRTIIAALSLVVLAGSTACCAAAHPPPGEAPSASTAALRPPGEAQIGDRTTCPVSGEQFIVSATSPWIEHDGKMYYFCCADCAQKFQADPAKYLSHTGDSRLTGAPATPTPGAPAPTSP